MTMFIWGKTTAVVFDSKMISRDVLKVAVEIANYPMKITKPVRHTVETGRTLKQRFADDLQSTPRLALTQLGEIVVDDLTDRKWRRHQSKLFDRLHS
ncbi:hypothetical protein Bxe_A0252 [Paraburkholderia xenovorans LB400]|uniref:Uncharacterized protein n=1 Tax=Paraburkholderia xenovorans (strain LB400) TaxID=266265 RepID=Q13TA8_PARXL|nr:hypothetical protein Bxe_A0252 [Paraburkholderia xenovorans LB400]